MRREFISNNAGIDWIVNLVISAMTYEEYISLGKYFDGSYFSFRDLMVSCLRRHRLNPKYDFIKTQEIINEQLDKFRKDESIWAFYQLVEDIKNYLFVRTTDEMINERTREKMLNKWKRDVIKIQESSLEKQLGDVVECFFRRNYLNPNYNFKKSHEEINEQLEKFKNSRDYTNLLQSLNGN